MRAVDRAIDTFLDALDPETRAALESGETESHLAMRAAGVDPNAARILSPLDMPGVREAVETWTILDAERTGQAADAARLITSVWESAVKVGLNDRLRSAADYLGIDENSSVI